MVKYRLSPLWTTAEIVVFLPTFFTIYCAQLHTYKIKIHTFNLAT